jgi:hypothetical protein
LYQETWIAAQTSAERLDKNRLIYSASLLLIMSYSFRRKEKKNQVPSPPKPPSSSEEREELQKTLKRYNCTLSEGLSEKTRNIGLEEGKTVCSVVNIAVEEYIRRRRESDKSS